jgi:hypothetical protein
MPLVPPALLLLLLLLPLPVAVGPLPPQSVLLPLVAGCLRRESGLARQHQAAPPPALVRQQATQQR